MHFYTDTSQNNHSLTKGEFLLTPVVYLFFTDVVRTVRNNGFTEGNFGKPTAMKTEGPVERFSLSIACLMNLWSQGPSELLLESPYDQALW